MQLLYTRSKINWTAISPSRLRGLDTLFRDSITEVIFVAAFSAFYFSYTLTHFDHNDFLYASSAHMSGRLYRDIHYNQAPFGFYFWQFVAALSPEGLTYP